MTRLTATGLESRVPHISIHTATATGETVTLCRACGESHREGWPGSVAVIERWMRDHRHPKEV